MAIGKLTIKAVESMLPSTVDVYLWDSDVKGFGVKVTPSGARIYLYQFRQGGRGSKTRRVTIGKHNEWIPELARKRARELAFEVAAGHDPVQERREQQRRSNALATSTYVLLFDKEYLKENWRGSHEDGARALKKYVVPVLKDKPVDAITRSDITAILTGIPASQRATKRFVFAVIRRMMGWAVSRGDIEPFRNPVLGYEAPPAPIARDRVLKDWEIPLIWKATFCMRFPAGTWLRFMIILGQRRGEMAKIEWRELNRTLREWVIPKERAKNGKAHIVPLPELAMVELDNIAGSQFWPRSGFVFTGGTSAIGGFSKAKAIIDANVSELLIEQGEAVETAELEAWRVHDLRRTFATCMQRLGVRFEVTEALLNHVSGSKCGIAGVYQRHDWQLEKIEAMNLWNNFLRGLIDIDYNRNLENQPISHSG